jgi:hypothetical protein
MQIQRLLQNDLVQNVDFQAFLTKHREIHAVFRSYSLILLVF